MKGPHSLGGKNENNIVTKYRGCHPSFIGTLDLLTCGNSDPGTSGVLSPFCDLKGLYFDTKGEPDDFIFSFMRDVKRILSSKGIDTLDIEFDSPEDYYKILSYSREFSKNNISVYGVSRDDVALTFIREDDVVAEHLRSDELEDIEVDDGSLKVVDVKEVEV